MLSRSTVSGLLGCGRRLGVISAGSVQGRSSGVIAGVRHNAASFSTGPCRRDTFNVQDVEDFNDKVVANKKPVIVDFHATWCGPCKLLGTRLDTALVGLEDKIDLAKVDIDELTDLAIEHGVTSVPTVKALKDGETVAEFVGVLSEEDLNDFLGKLI